MIQNQKSKYLQIRRASVEVQVESGVPNGHRSKILGIIRSGRGGDRTRDGGSSSLDRRGNCLVEFLECLPDFLSTVPCNSSAGGDLLDLELGTSPNMVVGGGDSNVRKSCSSSNGSREMHCSWLRMLEEGEVKGVTRVEEYD